MGYRLRVNYKFLPSSTPPAECNAKFAFIDRLRQDYDYARNNTLGALRPIKSNIRGAKHSEH